MKVIRSVIYIIAEFAAQSFVRTRGGAAMTPLDIAKSYIQRGWNPTPIPFKSEETARGRMAEKNYRRLNANAFFGDQPQNVGVIWGRRPADLLTLILIAPKQ